MAIKNDLRLFATRLNFKALGNFGGAAALPLLRQTHGGFREHFENVSDADLWRAIEADMPKLAEINRKFWPEHHVEG